MIVKKSLIKELIAEVKNEYQEFFKSACKKFNIDPDNIDNIDEKKKKKLFNYIDKNWNTSSEAGKDGKKINESMEFNFKKALKLITNDEFLRYIYMSIKGKSKEEKVKKVFDEYILSDKKYLKRYKS
jgi:hypothetical protein